MPAHVALSEFLETGFFGPVEPGMERSEVESVLGPPDDAGVPARGQREPRVWRYGSFEIHFGKGGGARLVCADGFERLDGGSRVRLDAWGLSGASTRAEVERRLRAAGIAFAPVLHPWDEGTDELLTAGLVSVLFAAGRLAALRRDASPAAVVAEAFRRREADDEAERWKSAHPEIAGLVPEDGWRLSAFREEDGRTLYRVQAEFAPEPEAAGHSHR